MLARDAYEGRGLAHDQLFFLTVAGFGPAPLRSEYAKSYATTPSMVGLVRDGLVEIVPAVPGSLHSVIVATPRGRVMLEAMCALPLPEQVNEWRMPS